MMRVIYGRMDSLDRECAYIRVRKMYAQTYYEIKLLDDKLFEKTAQLFALQRQYPELAVKVRLTFLNKLTKDGYETGKWAWRQAVKKHSLRIKHNARAQYEFGRLGQVKL